MKTARKTDWETKELPAKRSTISMSGTFSPHEIQRVQAGLVPEQMEDKWFIYWQDDKLFFHRSWTGFCIYVVRFATEGDCYRMIEAHLNRDPDQYGETDDTRDAKMISYLIDALLLKKHTAFPSEDSDSEKEALMQWSQVGRAMLGQHPEND
jgi:hypothetical protein